MSAGVQTSGVRMVRPLHHLNLTSLAPASSTSNMQTSSSSSFHSHPQSLSPTRIHHHQHAHKHQQEEDMHQSTIDNDLSAACAHSLHMVDRPDARSVNSLSSHVVDHASASRTSSALHLTPQHMPNTHQLPIQQPIALLPQQPLPVSYGSFTPSFASQSYVSGVSSTHPSPAFWSASSQVTSPATRYQSPDATPLQDTSEHAGQLPPPLDCSRLGEELDAELAAEDTKEDLTLGAAPSESLLPITTAGRQSVGLPHRNHTFQPSGAHSLTASPATQASLSVLSLKFSKSSDIALAAAAANVAESSPAPYRPSKARRLSLPTVSSGSGGGDASHVSTAIAQSESRFNSFPLIQPRGSISSSHPMDDEEVANAFHSRTPSLTSSSSFSSSASSSLALDSSAPLTPASVGVKLRVRSIRNNQGSALSDHADFNFNFNNNRSTPVRSARATLPSLSTAAMIQKSFEEDRTKRLSPLPPSLSASASRAKRKHGLDPNEPFEPLGSNNMANSLDVAFTADLFMTPEPFVPQLPFQNASTPFISPSVSPAIAPLASCLNPPTSASRRVFHKYRSAGSGTTSPCISAAPTPLMSPALVAAKTDSSDASFSSHQSQFWRQSQ